MLALLILSLKLLPLLFVVHLCLAPQEKEHPVGGEDGSEVGKVGERRWATRERARRSVRPSLDCLEVDISTFQVS